jgi:hypothetical protein
MALRSALEDLRDTTLRKVSGLLGRLEYLSRLRTKEGRYSHWGLSRIHGDAAAGEALSQAHQSTIAGVLRTPLRKMVHDAETSSEGQGIPATEYTKALHDRAEELLPPSPGAGSARPLKSVLRVLSYLTKSR